MHERPSTAPHSGYDWSRFGRHRLRAPASVLIDSPLGAAGSGWLGTVWPAGDSSGWARMLWTPNPNLGGWTIPSRLAGGDVIEFGADHDGHVVRWYGILDSYDAVEWLTLQGPYAEPCAAHGDAERILDGLRYAQARRSQHHASACTRHRV